MTARYQFLPWVRQGVATAIQTVDTLGAGIAPRVVLPLQLRVNPEGEADELVQAWTARGLPARLAREVADVLKAHPDQALRVHAQEELGVVPDELPSPWTAAGSSFVCFAVGAVIPLLTLLLGYDQLWRPWQWAGWACSGRVRWCPG